MSLIRLRYCVGERIADAIERVCDRAGKAVHRSDRAETNEGRDQGVFDKVLTGLFRDQVLQKLLHVHHSVLRVGTGLVEGVSRGRLNLSAARADRRRLHERRRLALT